MNGKLPLLTIVAVTICGLCIAVVGRSRAEPVDSGHDSRSRTVDFSVASTQNRAKGSALFKRARSALAERRSVAARVRFRVQMFDADIVGSGIYLQLDRNEGFSFLWELRTQVAGDTSSLTQVSDGRFLWTDRILPSGQSVTRVDLRQFPSHGAADKMIVDDGPNRESRDGDTATDLFGGGGLPRLFAVLDETYEFGPARPATLLGVPVLVVTGHKIENGAAQQSEPDIDVHHALRRVQIAFGRDDFFPYRMEFFEVGASRSGGPVEDAGRSALLVEWYDVQLDGQIDPRRFSYAPPAEANWRDITEEYRTTRGNGD